MITTFQAIVYSVLHALGEFFPVGSRGLTESASALLAWEPVDPITRTAIALGATLAIFVYFRHDWASVISSFFQVIIFRRKPQSFDEMLAFLIVLSFVPVLLFGAYADALVPWSSLPIWFGPAALTVLSAIFLFLHGRNKKNRNIFAWNYGDALGAGFFQLLHFLPGGGALFGTALFATFRNYHPEAIGKFCVLSLFPIFLGQTLSSWGSIEQSWGPDASWLTFGAALLCSLFAGVLAIGAFLNGVTRKALTGSMLFRFFLSAGWLAAVLLRA